MLISVLSMNVLGDYLIPFRSQWRTSNSQVPKMHVEQQMENMVPRKAEMQLGTWGQLETLGHCGKCNFLPNIVKLPNLHRRLTRQKMRTDNFFLRRNALAYFGNYPCESSFSEAPLLVTVVPVLCPPICVKPLHAARF